MKPLGRSKRATPRTRVPMRPALLWAIERWRTERAPITMRPGDLLILAEFLDPSVKTFRAGALPEIETWCQRVEAGGSATTASLALRCIEAFDDDYVGRRVALVVWAVLREKEEEGDGCGSVQGC